LKVTNGLADEGLGEIQQALVDAGARRDDEQTFAALVALGDANWILDRTQVAATNYQQALTLLQERPHVANEAALRIRLAGLGSLTGREEQGVESAKRAVTLYQSLHDASREAAAWSVLASLHQTLGHASEAEEALNRALAIYRQQAVTVHAGFGSPSKASPRESR
jgi:tetratricopeptide (TPR) repeat protein